jgi:hypothetical protein
MADKSRKLTFAGLSAKFQTSFLTIRKSGRQIVNIQREDIKMSYFDIEKKALVAWYELRVSDKKLVVDIHPRAWNFFVHALRENPRLVSETPRLLKIPEFIPLQENPWAWGFGGSASWKKSRRENWISAVFKLPIFSAERESSNSVWDRLFSISATLELLFKILLIFEENISDYYSPQLLVVSGMSFERNLFGGSLLVILSKDACEFLAEEIKIHGETIRYFPIIDAMQKAFSYIEGKEPSFMDFRAMLRPPKWLHLSVPGNACGLDPGNYYDEESFRGYEMLPHNVDNPLQQIYLLAGVFSLYDHIRKWWWIDKRREEIKSALRERDLSVGYDMGNDFTILSRKSNEKPICGVDGEVTLKEILERYLV